MDDENAGVTPQDEGALPPHDAGEEAAAEAGLPEPSPEDTAPTTVFAAGAAGEDEAGETLVTPAADEATRVMGGQAEDDTRVMAGVSEDATRIVPPGGVEGGTPPPPRPQPTLMMSRPPRQSSSGTLWIVIIVIILALAAAAAAWYFLLRDTGGTSPTPSPTPTTGFAWVGAWGRTDGSGGGLVVQKSGDAYQVTVYDSMVQVLGSATAAEEGNELTFDLQTEEAVAGLPGPYAVRLTPGSTADLLSMSVTGSNGTTIIVPLERVPALVPVTPTASPSPSSSPTASPSSSPTVSPSPSQTAADQQVVAGIQKLQVGVITWATNNNNLYPEPGDVTQTGGIASYVDPWPTNPYTGQPMKPGTSPGDYTYQQLNGGAGYQLTGYIADGLTYTVP
jgi:hypothetical protein